MLPLCVHRGHDFRTAFDKLGGLRALTDAPFMALTASAPANTQSKIIESLHLKDPIVSQSLDKANIYLSASPIRSVNVSYRYVIVTIVTGFGKTLRKGSAHKSRNARF